MPRPRRRVFRRDPADGRIVSVRFEGDELLSTEWLWRDPDVIQFFQELDRRRALARGEIVEDEPDLEELEHERQERLAAARHARAQRRIRR